MSNLKKLIEQLEKLSGKKVSLTEATYVSVGHSGRDYLAAAKGTPVDPSYGQSPGQRFKWFDIFLDDKLVSSQITFSKLDARIKKLSKEYNRPITDFKKIKSV